LPKRECLHLLNMGFGIAKCECKSPRIVWCGLVSKMVGFLFFLEQTTICMVARDVDAACSTARIDDHSALMF
jgi:hypothetical protein